MARRFFQLHFASTIVLFISMALMLGWNVAMYSTSRPTFNDVMRNIIGVMFLIGAELLFALYPTVMIEAWLRRRDDGRVLNLRSGTRVLLAVGIGLFLLSNTVFGGFPVDFEFMRSAKPYVIGLCLNFYAWLVVWSVLAYVWEVAV